MFCTKCGRQNADTAKFCIGCGAKLIAAGQTQNRQSQDSNQTQGVNRTQNRQTQGANGTQNRQTQGANGTQNRQTQGANRTQGRQMKNRNQAHNQRNTGGKQTATAGRPRRRTSGGSFKPVLIILLVVVILAAGAGGAYGYLSSRLSAKAYASEYAEACKEQEWETVYEMTDWPESDFLTQSAFLQAVEEADRGDISEYSVSKRSDSGDSVKYFRVSFTRSGEGVSTETVEVVEQDEKVYKIFSTWKLYSNELVVEDYSITVPAASVLVIDDITVDTASGSGDSVTVDVTLFAGTHDITVQADGYETYESTFTTDTDFSAVTTASLTPSADNSAEEDAEENGTEDEDEDEEEEEEKEEEEPDDESEITEGIDSTTGYIISYSSSRLLTDADIEGMTAQELNYAKNEIYARHGRMFDSSELQTYFNSKEWYEPLYEPEEFDDLDLLSSVEKKNAEFLREAVDDAGGYTPK